VKNFLKYLALGICTTMPVVAFAQVPSNPNQVAKVPGCCITCANANDLQVCYTSCTDCSTDASSGTSPRQLCNHWCDIQGFPH